MAKIQSLTPLETDAFLRDHPTAVFADVRSSMEFFFVGHPVGAVNIAWIDDPDWEINPQFIRQIQDLAEQRAPDAALAIPIVLICRSGVRSLEAGEELLEAGFTQIYNVLEGFEGELNDQHQRGKTGGWRFHGLPWEQC